MDKSIKSDNQQEMVSMMKRNIIMQEKKTPIKRKSIEATLGCTPVKRAVEKRISSNIIDLHEDIILTECDKNPRMFSISSTPLIHLYRTNDNIKTLNTTNTNDTTVVATNTVVTKNPTTTTTNIYDESIIDDEELQQDANNLSQSTIVTPLPYRKRVSKISHQNNTIGLLYKNSPLSSIIKSIDSTYDKQEYSNKINQIFKDQSSNQQLGPQQQCNPQQQLNITNEEQQQSSPQEYHRRGHQKYSMNNDIKIDLQKYNTTQQDKDTQNHDSMYKSQEIANTQHDLNDTNNITQQDDHHNDDISFTSTPNFSIQQTPVHSTSLSFMSPYKHHTLASYANSMIAMYSNIDDTNKNKIIYINKQEEQQQEQQQQEKELILLLQDEQSINNPSQKEIKDTKWNIIKIPTKQKDTVSTISELNQTNHYMNLAKDTKELSISIMNTSLDDAQINKMLSCTNNKKVSLRRSSTTPVIDLLYRDGRNVSSSNDCNCYGNSDNNNVVTDANINVNTNTDTNINSNTNADIVADADTDVNTNVNGDTDADGDGCDAESHINTNADDADDADDIDDVDDFDDFDDAEKYKSNIKDGEQDDTGINNSTSTDGIIQSEEVTKSSLNTKKKYISPYSSIYKLKDTNTIGVNTTNNNNRNDSTTDNIIQMAETNEQVRVNSWFPPQCDIELKQDDDDEYHSCHESNSSINTSDQRGRWSLSEDERQREAVKKNHGKSWKRISYEAFKGERSDVQCLHRWQKVLKPGQYKGPWTPEDDSKQIQLVQKYGVKKWSKIAREIPGRLGKQCRERWHNHLDPSIVKYPWTEEEDRIIINEHNKYGNKWAKIASKQIGRTDNAIKNRWNSTLSRIQHRYKQDTVINDSTNDTINGTIITNNTNNNNKEEIIDTKIKNIQDKIDTVEQEDENIILNNEEIEKRQIQYQGMQTWSTQQNHNLQQDKDKDKILKSSQSSNKYDTTNNNKQYMIQHFLDLPVHQQKEILAQGYNVMQQQQQPSINVNNNKSLSQYDSSLEDTSITLSPQKSLLSNNQLQSKSTVSNYSINQSTSSSLSSSSPSLLLSLGVGECGDINSPSSITKCLKCTSVQDIQIKNQQSSENSKLDTTNITKQYSPLQLSPNNTKNNISTKTTTNQPNVHKQHTKHLGKNQSVESQNLPQQQQQQPMMQLFPSVIQKRNTYAQQQSDQLYVSPVATYKNSQKNIDDSGSLIKNTDLMEELSSKICQLQQQQQQQQIDDTLHNDRGQRRQNFLSPSQSSPNSKIKNTSLFKQANMALQKRQNIIKDPQKITKINQSLQPQTPISYNTRQQQPQSQLFTTGNLSSFSQRNPQQQQHPIHALCKDDGIYISEVTDGAMSTDAGT